MGVVFNFESEKSKEEVIKEVLDQLSLIKTPNVVEGIRKFLVDPTHHLAIWDYSEKETKFPVWLVAASEEVDTGILYSECGFDFGNWGLTKLSDQPFHFGPDFYWYPTLENAFLESWMVDDQGSKFNKNYR